MFEARQRRSSNRAQRPPSALPQDDSMLTHTLLGVAAFVSGIMNAVAGGGAFTTFPALLFAGVPAVYANPTRTVALFPGQATSAWAYRSDIFTVTQVNVTALIEISLVSGVLGALLLLYTSNAVFIRLVPWLLQVRLAAMPTIFAEAGAC
jgi:uncharacterized protein